MKRRNLRILSVGLLAGLFLAVPSALLAQQAVLERISRNSQIEIKMSKLAQKNSQNANVKSFAKQVVKDNGGIAGQVFSASITYSYHLQTEIPDAQEAAMEKMKTLKGTDFDKMYLVQMQGLVKDDKDVGSKASSNTKESDVSAIGDQLQSISEKRLAQITKLTQEENFTIQ